VAEERVGIEIELGVQRLDGPATFEDQRVDLGQGCIGGHVAAVELFQHVHG
jgi:hypothetical protein